MRLISEKHYLYGLKSSEDVFWFFVGDSVIYKKGSINKDVGNYFELIKYVNFLNARYTNAKHYINWGQFIDTLYVDENKKEPLYSYKLTYALFLKEKLSDSGENQFSNFIKSLIDKNDSFNSMLSLIKTSIISIRQLQMFLTGYIEAASLYKTCQNEVNYYVLIKELVTESIRKEFKIREDSFNIFDFLSLTMSDKAGLDFFFKKFNETSGIISPF